MATPTPCFCISRKRTSPPKGNREFNVAINGTTVLTNLDIYGSVGANAALLETFTATANSSGEIVIVFSAGAANQPVVSGIEIRGTSAACGTPPSAPAGFTATASSSSTIALTWAAVTPPANCTINSYSVYGSKTSGFTPSTSNLIASGLTGTSYTNTGAYGLDNLLLRCRSRGLRRKLDGVRTSERGDFSGCLLYSSCSPRGTDGDCRLFKRYRPVLDSSDPAH